MGYGIKTLKDLCFFKTSYDVTLEVWNSLEDKFHEASKKYSSNGSYRLTSYQGLFKGLFRDKRLKDKGELTNSIASFAKVKKHTRFNGMKLYD